MFPPAKMQAKWKETDKQNQKTPRGYSIHYSGSSTENEKHCIDSRVRKHTCTQQRDLGSWETRKYGEIKKRAFPNHNINWHKTRSGYFPRLVQSFRYRINWVCSVLWDLCVCTCRLFFTMKKRLWPWSKNCLFVFFLFSDEFLMNFFVSSKRSASRLCRRLLFN